MFEKKQYIVSSSFGVCMVEKVTKLVVGKERQMEYYVLQSAKDKTKKSYIPVEEHKTVLRNLMTVEKAEKILEQLPINTKEEAQKKVITYSEAKEWLDSGTPENWQLGASYYLWKERDLDSQLHEVMSKIWENLQAELAFVMKKSQEDIRQMVENKVY